MVIFKRTGCKLSSFFFHKFLPEIIENLNTYKIDKLHDSVGIFDYKTLIWQPIKVNKPQNEEKFHEIDRFTKPKVTYRCDLKILRAIKSNIILSVGTWHVIMNEKKTFDIVSNSSNFTIILKLNEVFYHANDATNKL